MNTGSRSLVEVGVSMVLRDHFTKESGKISQSFRTMMSDMDAAARGFENSFGNISEIGTQLVSSMYDAYKYSADVQNQVFLTSKIAGADRKQALALMDKALEVNAITPLSAMDVASGERFLAMAGNSAEAIQDMIEPAAKLASIFSSPLGGKGGVADMMTNIMAGFGINSSQSTSVADDMFTAVTNANMSMEDLMATIRYSVADMRAAGVSMRELAAATGALGDVGIQGTMAGTSLGNMVRYLQLSLAGQKKYGKDTLNELGLSVEDFYDTTTGKFKGLYNAFQQFLGVYQNMSQIGRTQDFYNIFGVRGMRGIIPILEAMANGNDKMGLILSKYDANQGVVDRTMAEYLETNRGTIESLESSIENLKVIWGKSIGGPFNFFTKAATWGVDSLSSLLQTKAGGTIAGTAATGVTLATVYYTLKGGLVFIRNISAYTATIQTELATTSAGITNTATILKTGFSAIEYSLRMIQTNQRVLIAHGQGLSFNSAGQLIDRKTGRYVSPKGKNLGVGLSDNLFDAMILAQMGKKGAGQAATKAAGNAMVRGIGAIANVGLKLLPGLGWIFTIATFVPMIFDVVKMIKGDTEEMKEQRRQEELRKRKQQEQLWMEAVKWGVIEGLKQSGGLRVTVNPGEANAIQVGGESMVSYPGETLLGF